MTNLRGMSDEVPGVALLREELSRRGIRPAEAARQLGVSKPTMGEWLAGGLRPSFLRRPEIRSWSEGRIPEDSWLTAEERARLALVPPTPAAE